MGAGSAPAQGTGAEATTGSAAPDNNPTRVAARLWALLTGLLRMHEVGPGATANPTLVSAAAHACRSAAQDALRTLGTDVSADLADALLDALRLLAAKDRLHFSPSLEHRCTKSFYNQQLMSCLGVRCSHVASHSDRKP